MRRHPLHPSYATTPALWARHHLRFQPDPIQSEILSAADPYILLNCTRQWGKTTVIAAKALHFALFHPRTTTLVAAPSERQSFLLLRRLRTFLQTLGLKPAPAHSIPLSIRLSNTSEIIALPASGDTIRGFTAHLLIFDEAARVPDSLFHALLPARATTAGPLWLLSTPNGPSGFFYDAWHADDASSIRNADPPVRARFPGPVHPAGDRPVSVHSNRELRERDSVGDCPQCPQPVTPLAPPTADPDTAGLSPDLSPLDREPGEQAFDHPTTSSSPSWARFLVPATACSRISAEFLAHERIHLGDVMFRQEYLCEFVAGPHTFFSLELLESATGHDHPPLFTEPLFSNWNRS